jgi:hypothetical protein
MEKTSQEKLPRKNLTKRIVIEVFMDVIDHLNPHPMTTAIIIIITIANGINEEKVARDDGTTNEGIGRDLTMMMREVMIERR